MILVPFPPSFWFSCPLPVSISHSKVLGDTDTLFVLKLGFSDTLSQSVLSGGIALNDGEWHELKWVHNHEKVRLLVDGAMVNSSKPLQLSKRLDLGDQVCRNFFSTLRFYTTAVLGFCTNCLLIAKAGHRVR